MNIFKSTWHHIRRSPFQSLAALVIMSNTFFTITLFLIFSSGVSTLLNHFETKPEVTIFIKDGLDRERVESIHKNLSDYPSIREIKYVSKEDALKIYKDLNKDNPLVTEMVTASILPASFEVSTSDPKVLEQIAKDFSEKSDLVQDVIYQKDIIKNLLDWTSIIKKIGIFLVVKEILTSCLIIFVIIGMKVTSRKEEIRISRLLGASKLYVKKPFLLEGLIYGFAGSLVGFIISFTISMYFKNDINNYFNPIVFIPANVYFYLVLLAGQILVGLMTGFIASWIGVRRYIKY